MMGVGSLMSSSRGSGEGGAVSVAFTPSSLSPLVWLDFSDLSTLWKDTARTDPVTADGDAVASVTDKSGNGYHLVQETAANRPLYKTDGTYRWLLFDGVNDAFNFAVSVPISDNMTFCRALSRSSSSHHSMGIGNSLGIAHEEYWWSDSKHYHGQVAGAADTATGNFLLTTIRAGAATSTLRRNAIQHSTGTAYTASATSQPLFGSAGMQFTNGKIYQQIVCASALSGANLASLETWVGAKAGLVL